MIVYNVTVNVEDGIVEDWLQWMKSTHIPEIMSLNIFTKAQISEVISQTDSGKTYAISYMCSSLQQLHTYQVHYAPKFQSESLSRYGNKSLAFRTILKVLKEY